MNNQGLVNLESSISRKGGKVKRGKILLVKPPFFTPWTPPLGISILKAYLEKHGYSVRCYDFNTDSLLWGTHHKYFEALQSKEDVSINDGYSKLWWILNAHMLAYANGASRETITGVLERIVPLFGIRHDESTIKSLIPIVERYFAKLAEIIDGFDLSDYSVVGTSTYTTSLSASLFMLERIKRKRPDILAVMGGGIFADDLALGSDNLATLLEKYQFVDHVILGEGEMLFLKLLEGELAHKRVISIADLEGKTVEMSDIPAPDFSDLNSDHYYHLTIEGARSCPFQCSFCSETVQWGDYRKKPTDLFAQQVIDLAKTYKNNSFFMGDSLMNPYINPFATALIEKKANVKYDGYLRADKPVTNRKFVKLWADSGLYRVRLGIESAAARVLDSMDKMTTPKVISDVLKTLASRGIRTTTYWIVGFPGETEEDFKETCDFIRAHHPYIYELEAHPYYYYPYGQIGSRLHQCFSLYPQEVIDVINFKLWEIIDSNPSRDERYDRLRRISMLAAELKLPNIYTMAERYVAEERWQRLHPLAVEVYDGTFQARKPVNLAIKSAAARTESDRNNASFSGYRASVKKCLLEEALAQSVEQLIVRNDVLLMSINDGKWSASRAAAADRQALSIHDLKGKELEEIETAREEIINRLAAELSPESGSSIRVAVIEKKEEESEVLLLAHPAIADTRSVILLLEDLFRIYEQISNDQPVILLPVKKSFTEFLGEVESKENSLVELVERHSQDFTGDSLKTRTVSIGNDVKEKLFSQTLVKNDLRPEEAVAAALIRIFKRSFADEKVDLRLDYRSTDSSLSDTAGPLARRLGLSPETLKDIDRSAGLREVSRLMRQGAGENSAHENGEVLLNLDYFQPEPWIGRDTWFPEGFIIDRNSGIGSYKIEILPVISNEGIEIVLRGRDVPRFDKLADAIHGLVSEELRRIIDQCERYIEAMEFWEGEIKEIAQAANLEIGIEEPVSQDTGRATFRCRISEDSLNYLQTECVATAASVLLAAYSVMLSRLSGKEETVIVSAIGNGVECEVMPLRLDPSWDLSFRDHVRRVERKVKAVSEFAEDSLNIVNQHYSRKGNEAPAFDTGYIFTQCGESDTAVTMQDIYNDRYPNMEVPDLLLEATASSGVVRVCFDYDRKRLGAEAVETLATLFRTVLDEASSNIDVELGAASVSNTGGSADVPSSLAQDVFNF